MGPPGGMSALIRGDTRVSSLHHVKTQREVGHLREVGEEEGPHQDPNVTWSWTSRTERKKCMLLEPPRLWHCVIAA